MFNRLLTQSPFFDQPFTVTFAFSKAGLGPFPISGLGHISSLSAIRGNEAHGLSGAP